MIQKETTTLPTLPRREREGIKMINQKRDRESLSVASLASLERQRSVLQSNFGRKPDTEGEDKSDTEIQIAIHPGSTSA